MEQHPIPQDVTGFQFRLIGSMTVKQFAYVASGVIAAVGLYYLPLSGFLGFILKLIFIPLFGASGFAFAFLPIEGRPIDLMTANFFKALFAPNQYVYRKVGRHLAAATRPQQPKATVAQPTINKEQQLQRLLQEAHIQTHTKLDDKEDVFFNELTTTPLGTQTTLPPAMQGVAPVAQPPVMQAPPVTPTPTNSLTPTRTLTPTVTPVQTPSAIPTVGGESSMPTSSQQPAPQQSTSSPFQDENVQQVQTTTPAVPQDQITNPQPVPDQVTTLEQKLKEEQLKNQQLQQELSKLKTSVKPRPSQAQQVAVTPGQPQTSQPQVQSPIQYVRNIPKELLQQAGLTHLPDVPNVAVGIVKDSRSNVLPNILVEIKDTEGNPVRAFKTNPLGQFASATPLAPGVYTIELEDPKKQHLFDIIQFTANNQVMLPIEIISHDAREDLRKELSS